MYVKALPLAKRLIRCGTIAAITATLVTALIPGEVAAQAGAVACKVSLRSSNGKFICAEGGGGGAVVANRGALGAWETFTLHDLNGGNLVDGNKVTLQAANGKYVCAEGGGGGAVVANRGAVGAWETFTFRRIGTA